MTDKVSQIVITRSIARRLIEKIAKPEYRITIYFGSGEVNNVINLLRCMRNGKVKDPSIPYIPDLGIKETMDGVEVWSRDYDGMKKLDQWATKRRFETSGIW